MKRKIVSGIMLTLLFIGMLTLAFNIQPVKAEPKTWYVDDSGGADFTEIHDAVYAASAGDTIYVYNGTYYENIGISKSLTIIGENNYATIIDGSGAGPVVGIYGGSYVNFTRFTVRNAGLGEPPFGIAVYLYHASLCNVSDNIVLNSRHGIASLGYSSDNIIIGNTISGTEIGIVFWTQSINTFVIGNSISNFFFSGIYFNYPYDIQVIGNRVTGSSGEGIHFEEGGSNNLVSENTVTECASAIEVSWADNNVIRGNNVSSNYCGIELYETHGNTIINNLASNNYCGVTLFSSNNNKFYHNNFIDNTQQVYIETSGYANFWDNGYPSGGNYWSDYSDVDSYSGPYQNLTGSDGIWDHPYIIDVNNRDNYPLANPWSSLPVHNINTGLGYAAIQEAVSAPETLDGHTIFVEAGTYYENVVVHKSIRLVGEGRDTAIIDGSGVGTVVQVTASGVSISSFTVRKSGDYPNSGINVDTDHCTITNNIIVNTGDGICLDSSSSNNSISGNDIRENNYGIWLDSSSNNNISENNIAANMWFEIYLNFSSNNCIIGNNITASDGGGIALVSSSGNSIIGNNITAASYHGIGLLYSSNNSIIGNNITNNDYGITLADSSDNSIYHNNIIDNAHQVYDYSWDYPEILPSINTWDDGYPSGGNYWSDHNPSDIYGGPYQNETGRDGIGDKPYIIDGNNVDRYPLIYPYGYVPSPDVNGDGIVDIYDVVIASLAFGTKPGYSNWNPQADLNNDGLIDIFDLVIIGINYGKRL